MISKILSFGAFGLMVLLDLATIIYCVLGMIEHPCMLDIKIAATVVTVFTLGFFTWFIYELSKDVTNGK